MAIITGVDGMVAFFQRRKAASKQDHDATFTVGVTAPYAVFVHEDLEAAHGEVFNTKHAADIAAGRTHMRRPQEQAKFIEEPSRRLNHNGTFKRIIVEQMKNGRTLRQALRSCGLRLKKEIDEIIPTDTGEMRDGLFIKTEK